MHEYSFTTGPPNGPVLFCSLASVVCLLRFSSSATLLAGGPAGRRARGRSGGRHCTSAQYGYVPLGRHLVTYIATVCKLRPITCNKKLSYRRGTARRSMLVDIVFLKTTVKASLPSNHLFHFTAQLYVQFSSTVSVFLCGTMLSLRHKLNSLKLFRR